MYDAGELSRLQSIEIEMLKVFDNICRKNGIKYFLTFGSAIGCIRHQGMIPWDDDIDIGMMYEDYCKLKKISRDEWPQGVVLCDPSDDNEDHLYPYPRIYKDGTHFIPENQKGLNDRKKNNTQKSNNGIWVDIFVYHRTSSPKKAIKLDNKVMALRKKYMFCKKYQKIYGVKSIKRILINVFENIYHWWINLIFKSPEKSIYDKYESLFENSGDYVVTYDARPSGPSKSVMKYDEMFPVIEKEFADMKVMMVKNYDLMLRQIYGDYMQIPPVEKRIIHTPYILDFGDK